MKPEIDALATSPDRWPFTAALTIPVESLPSADALPSLATNVKEPLRRM
jgi:hypothetical protein